MAQFHLISEAAVKEMMQQYVFELQEQRAHGRLAILFGFVRCWCCCFLFAALSSPSLALVMQVSLERCAKQSR